MHSTMHILYSRCSALYTPGQRCVIANLLANFHMSAKMLSICASGGTKSLNDESKHAGKCLVNAGH